MTDPRRVKVFEASQFGASISYSGEGVTIGGQTFTKTELRKLDESKTSSADGINQDERDEQRRQRDLERAERERERERAREQAQAERVEREKQKELQRQAKEAERAERKRKTKLELEHGAYSQNPAPGVTYSEEGDLIVSGGSHTFRASGFTFGKSEKLPELEGADFSLYGSYVNQSIINYLKNIARHLLQWGKVGNILFPRWSTLKASASMNTNSFLQERCFERNSSFVKGYKLLRVFLSPKKSNWVFSSFS